MGMAWILLWDEGSPLLPWSNFGMLGFEIIKVSSFSQDAYEVYGHTHGSFRCDFNIASVCGSDRHQMKSMIVQPFGKLSFGLKLLDFLVV